MADDDKLREQMDRGERARRILEDELFVEACKKARDSIFTEFEDSKWDDRERREFLDKQLRALKNIVSYIKVVMINGDAASKELREPSKLKRVI